MPRNKDESTKVTIIVDHKQGASICKSIRLKDGLTKEEAIEKSVEFLKSKL